MSDRKCMYRLSGGSFCKRWASAGSKFCHHHEGSTAYFQASKAEELHPLARLTTPEDIFDMLREALNATRLGRMSSGQAHAIGHLAAEWRKTFELLSFRQREMNLHRQFLTDVMVDDKELEAERAAAPHPLPVAIDDRAIVNQPNPYARPLEPIDSDPHNPQPAVANSAASRESEPRSNGHKPNTSVVFTGGEIATSPSP